ncbi:hypothetical protein GTP91_20235 [Rugamonas sp. FT82W]|uniref:Phosphoribosyltransferase n=1 Tax=Duganella vulcania TaxID=2692166 RepID=A0A845G4A3_9BURK|nr:phosphoribosyltransferase [Duganella vulcania]MYM89493.1 hypothetical protein [Duganella vulcania]
MDLPTRFPWDDFPDVLIHASEQHVKQHFSYLRAKTGDVLASVNLVLGSLSYETVNYMNRDFGPCAPVLLPVLAEESGGMNAIPRAMAEVLGHLLRWNVEGRVFQSNVVGHTGASGFVRLARQPVFKGRAESGLHCVLIDDFIGQGGTLANLRGHILAQGSQVLGASVLTGKAYSATLVPAGKQLAELRRKHGTIEFWWRQHFGFGFECLTASEVRYLIQTATSERVIERLEEAGRGR